MRIKKTHLSHYLALLAVLAAVFWGFGQFPYDKTFQVALVVAAGTGFVTWGLVHHHIHEDLHLRVVLEYIATATLGVFLLLWLILLS